MLYHDTTFTADQERYLQENIQWAFDEVVFSPLAVIDVIDKHVPQVIFLPPFPSHASLSLSLFFIVVSPFVPPSVSTATWH